jgi:hypothetical protein
MVRGRGPLLRFAAQYLLSRMMDAILSRLYLATLRMIMDIAQSK